jgi:hypothetical protein
LEAARRQITTAIRIYFANGDPVSTHTLAAAAFQIREQVEHAAIDFENDVSH